MSSITAQFFRQCFPSECWCTDYIARFGSVNDNPRWWTNALGRMPAPVCLVGTTLRFWSSGCSSARLSLSLSPSLQSAWPQCMTLALTWHCKPLHVTLTQHKCELSASWTATEPDSPRSAAAPAPLPLPSPHAPVSCSSFFVQCYSTWTLCTTLCDTDICASCLGLCVGSLSGVKLQLFSRWLIKDDKCIIAVRIEISLYTYRAVRI